MWNSTVGYRVRVWLQIKRYQVAEVASRCSWPLVRWSPVLRCSDCRHLFWRYDDRAYVSPRWQHGAGCALCNAIQDGREAWGLSNDCNGLFAQDIWHGRAEAKAALAADPEAREADCEVVPIVLLEEPAWRRDHRHWQETEAERMLGRPTSGPAR